MKFTAFVTTALVALAAASGANAQSAQPTNPGPALPGICIYSPERALVGSLVGQAVSARLEQLNAAVQAELQPEATAIQTEMTSLESSAATLPQDQVQQRATALQQRYENFQILGRTREMELTYTRDQQLARIGQTLDPIVAQIYQERGCGLLINRNALVGANPAMDISDRVIEVLNTQLTTLTFDRMPLPQQPAQ